MKLHPPGRPGSTLVLLLICGVGCVLFLSAAETLAGRAAAADFLEPALLTGSIWTKPPGPRKLLFTFRRSALRVGSEVRVLREYAQPDGTLAARERVVYENGRLSSCELEMPQCGGAGSAVVRADPENPGKRRILFEYSEKNRRKTGSESLLNDTLVNDMVGPFLSAHWDRLMSGSSVKFRFAVIPRAETVGFKLIRDSDTTWNGQAAVVVRMEPTSWIVARLVDPLLFTVEKDGAHRVFQYTGRTTPKIQTANGWQDLDALTVFDWMPAGNRPSLTPSRAEGGQPPGNLRRSGQGEPGSARRF